MEQIKYRFESCLKVIEAFTELGIQFESKTFDETEFKQLMDINIVDEEGQPKVTTNQETIIVCDEFDWNKSYLLELLYNAIETNRNVFENTLYPIKIIYYIDSNIGNYLKINNQMQYVKFGEMQPNQTVVPFILCLNPQTNGNHGTINALIEPVFGTLVQSQVTGLIEDTYIHGK